MTETPPLLPYDDVRPNDGEPGMPVGAAFPWPPPEDEPVAGAFVRTWQGATFQPTSFFRAMPHAGSLGAAILFYMVIGILVAGAQLFWDMIRPAALAPESILGLGDDGLHPLVGFLLSPLVLILSLFLSAAVTHLMLMMFGGNRHGVGLTSRVFAYAYSPMIFAVVPVLGVIVGFVWTVLVAIVGLREGHHTTTARAAAAVLIPVAIASVVLIGFALIAAAGALLETPL